MKPALAQICSLNSPFATDVEDYAAAHAGAIELWLGKLEGYLEDHPVEDVARLLDEHEIVAPVAAFQGGLLITQGDARREAWDLFARRLKYLPQLGVKTFVLAGDIVGPLTATDLERANVSLAEAAQQAGEHGLRLALEFQASAAVGNNLQSCAALVEGVGSPHLGICLDLFHFYTGPSKTEDLAHLTRENLFHVQLSDLADVPRELASDGDRILPGDGDVPLEPLIAQLEAIGYEGYVSVELMNPQIWQVPTSSFGEIAATALRKVLGQATMG
ncbi:MAG: sugar phosphate isomerase/epimerase [Planctomycetota bacterium]|nr:MAG: sugar phosphate isomerase/epimerase [Planctomycetota bacterium]